VKVCIVIPARNEEATIGLLVERAKRHGEVVVVNDGSTDETGPRAIDAGATVLYIQEQKGIANAVMTGWRWIDGAERIAVMDAGGSHQPGDLPMLLMRDTDIVIGSRFCPGGKYQGRRWRAFCSRAMGLICSLSQRGPFIWDWTSGYRVYSAEAVKYLQGLTYHAKMHGWQMEVLARAREAGMSIAEVPITYRAGGSSLKPGDILEAIRIHGMILHNMGGPK